MSRPLILGTRGSDLALTQARMAEAALAEAGYDCRIEVIKTIGDKRPDLKLSQFSQGIDPVVDKGIFTRELEEALLRGEIDFAVHSLKDVPTDLAPGFEICSTLPRAEIADVLLTSEPIADGPDTASSVIPWLTGRTIATSSVRRARQLAWLNPGASVVDIRGNVPTRIRKLVENPDWSAILLARAGLERLGIYRPGESAFAWGDGTVHAHELDPGEFFPAASQGAVAAEIRSENDLARRAMAAINHEPTYRRISAERAFLARLGAGCQTPVGARTWYEEDGSVLAMAVRVFDEDDPSAEPFVAEARGAPADPEGLANQLMQSKGESPDLK